MEFISDSSLEMAAKDAWQPGQPFSIILFYRYVFIEDVSLLLSQMQRLCTSLGLLGRLLIAKEGVNGTLAGSCSCIETFIKCMSQDRRFQHIDWKQTSSEPGQHHTSLPFLNLSIRESNEIVSSGKLRSFFEEMAPFDEKSFGGLANTGIHLKPHEFHAHLMALDNGINNAGTGDSNGKTDDIGVKSNHLDDHGTCPVDGSGNAASVGDSDAATAAAAAAAGSSVTRKGTKGLVFDVRNQFEYDIGRFEHATSLNCATYAGNFCLNHSYTAHICLPRTCRSAHLLWFSVVNSLVATTHIHPQCNPCCSGFLLTTSLIIVFLCLSCRVMAFLGPTVAREREGHTRIHVLHRSTNTPFHAASTYPYTPHSLTPCQHTRSCHINTPPHTLSRHAMPYQTQGVYGAKRPACMCVPRGSIKCIN